MHEVALVVAKVLHHRAIPSLSHNTNLGDLECIELVAVGSQSVVAVDNHKRTVVVAEWIHHNHHHNKKLALHLEIPCWYVT